MTTKVQKWGNSYAIRIPKEIIKELKLREGSSISFSTEDGSMIVTHTKRPEFSLNELLKGFNKKSKHEVVEWGNDIGKEEVIWQK
jgi:antitoxin MazE